MRDLREERFALNLHLPDYLGTYDSGVSLGEISGYQPPSGVSESILSDTSEDRESIRIGRINVDSKSGELVIKATARYKPKNPDGYETDRWDYTETEYLPAIRFRGLGVEYEALVSAFVEYVVNEEDDGFAGFYSKATQTNSLIDRLDDLTLPAMEDVEDGLNRYLNNLNEANRLDSQIERADKKINELIYCLYGLSEEEIERVKMFISDD